MGTCLGTNGSSMASCSEIAHCIAQSICYSRQNAFLTGASAAEGILLNSSTRNPRYQACFALLKDLYRPTWRFSVANFLFVLRFIFTNTTNQPVLQSSSLSITVFDSLRQAISGEPHHLSYFLPSRKQSLPFQYD